METAIPRANIAGMSLSGGRKENFFLCLLEFFPQEKRWFLSSLLQVKDELEADPNKVALAWAQDFALKEIVVDFPLTAPHCQGCTLPCPGSDHCPVSEVQEVRMMMGQILSQDQSFQENHPKQYERQRLEDSEVRYPDDIFRKDTSTHILSTSFKRRLKKGYLPYWNRPLDFWVWKEYYDQLLKLFKVSFDSYGQTSMMLSFRFHYLRRHFPSTLKFYESYGPLVLLELLRAKVISQKDLEALHSIDELAQARLRMIKNIEKSLGIFIYEKDLLTLSHDPRAFDSFLLALCGQQIMQKKIRAMPSWAQKENFAVPLFH